MDPKVAILLRKLNETMATPKANELELLNLMIDMMEKLTKQSDLVQQRYGHCYNLLPTDPWGEIFESTQGKKFSVSCSKKCESKFW